MVMTVHKDQLIVKTNAQNSNPHKSKLGLQAEAITYPLDFLLIPAPTHSISMFTLNPPNSPLDRTRPAP